MLGKPRPLETRRRVGSLLCTLTVGWFVGCGGNALVDGSGSNHAGASSTAGASSGAGASAVAGASPTDNPACSAAPESGKCNAYIPSFSHNPKTGLCEPFVYGGCGGNANRYASRDACLQACPAVSEDWGECVSDSDCAVLGASCCEACDPVTSEQLVAVNFAHQPLYGNSHCDGEWACAPCPHIPENQQTAKYFKPVCRNARCTLIDIRETTLSECKKTSDCMLREGARCCTECDGRGWVPVNKGADLCGGVPTACDTCTSKPPSNWDVVCLSGRCQFDGPL